MKPLVLQILALITLAHGVVGQKGRSVEGAAESMQSDDIHIRTAWTDIQIPLVENSSFKGRFDYMHQAVDYRPNTAVDPFGQDIDIGENLLGLQFDLETLRNAHQFSASINAYDGFRNPSSIWIDRYYRQQYSGGGIPGATYSDPDPWGIGTTIAYRYEAIPAAGYLTLSLGYLRDKVAPGYEIEDLGNSFELIKSKERLHTWTGSIEWEGVLNSRARTRQSIRITDTTDREIRVSWNGALNTLISDNWISRATASFATENPDFDAWSLAHTFEYSLNAQWALALTLRYYKDTGQIESANLISSAAPELSSRQAFLTVRYISPDQTIGFSFSIGPYETRYGATGIGTERFLNLYKDRNWMWTRLAARITF